jgi:hypothetical protein
MNKFTQFLDSHYRKIFLVLLVIIFVNTCGNPNKTTNRRLDKVAAELDSLKSTVVTKKELQIEGLKAEKRMIQSTDRKMMDVQRQSAIDEEIKSLEK